MSCAGGALTATATPIVQDDIAEQLGLVRPARLVHGFRRANIAIEVVEIAPSERPELARQLLRPAERRPAIVYTPTRKQAEGLAIELSRFFPAAAYHAGLDAHLRQEVQAEFQKGRIEVMVATIAFGMGIDKADIRTVIHTALPGSLEAYYQEIGRAGRDGKPSRTILMHSYADRYTHDFFIERDYPDISVLDEIFAHLEARPQGQGAVYGRRPSLRFAKGRRFIRSETGHGKSIAALVLQRRVHPSIKLRCSEVNLPLPPRHKHGRTDHKVCGPCATRGRCLSGSHGAVPEVTEPLGMGSMLSGGRESK